MTDPAPRIALIHATALAIAPIADAFSRQWPQAQRMNLLDDSLPGDLARDGGLTTQMVQRFVELADYASRCGCSGILFTCSAFGPAIEAAGAAVSMPVLKPNEAMLAQALNGLGTPTATRARVPRVGLVATFEPSIGSMAHELAQMASVRGTRYELKSLFVPQAMQDLAQGRADLHDAKIAQASAALADCDVVMLAQFSMASAQHQVQAQLPCSVVTSPDCAVAALKKLLAAGTANSKNKHA